MRSRHPVCGALILAVIAAPRVTAAAGFDPDDRRAARTTAEVGGGVVASAVGGVIGGFIAGQSCGSSGSSNPYIGLTDAIGCSVATAIGVFIGAYSAMGLGVWGTGTLVGGNGGAGYAYLGEGVGLLSAGTVSLFLSTASDDVPDWLYGSLLIALPLAGAVAGYELSTKREPRPGSGSNGNALSQPAFIMNLPISF